MSNDVDKMLEQTTHEMEQAKRVLQDLANEVSALTDIVQPALDKQIAALRAARMTTISEIQQTLGAMRDIRKFCTEEAFELEMERLERFVRVCRDIQELKRDGFFDAVCDTALRLAVKP